MRITITSICSTARPARNPHRLATIGLPSRSMGWIPAGRAALSPALLLIAPIRVP